MNTPTPIPIFTLFGETDDFPDVVHCETFSARAPIHAWHIEAHRHSNMAQLFVIREGRVKAVVDGMQSTLENMEFLYVPASKVHQFDFQPDTEGEVFSFPSGVLSAIATTSQELVAALSEPIISPIGTALDGPFKDLERATTGSSPFRVQRAVGLAHSVLAQIAEIGLGQQGRSNGDADDRVAKLNALLTEKMAEGWSAKDYAQALSVTTGHLSRLCRDATGLGASAYLEQAVMAEACRLLAFTQLPVSEVGYRLGYADPSYFSKRFRNLRGQTPSDYRATFRG